MTLALRTKHDFFYRTNEVVLRNFLAVFASGENSAFIHQRVEIGAGKSRRTLGYDAEIDILGKRLFSGMYFQNLFAIVSIRQIYDDTPIKTSRSEKCGIK